MTPSVTTPTSTEPARKVFSPGVVGVAIMPPPHGSTVVDFTFYDQQGGEAHEVTPADYKVIQAAVSRATRGTQLAAFVRWLEPGTQPNRRRLDLGVPIGERGLPQASLMSLLRVIAQRISAEPGYEGAVVRL